MPKQTQMQDRQTITSVRFRNFKAFREFSLSLRHMNVLVGPNNSGKSTVLGAFRALAVALRRAGAKSPQRVQIEGGKTAQGYQVASEDLPISLENVHTDYSEMDSSVVFRLSGGDAIRLVFPRDGGCNMVIETKDRLPDSPKDFRYRYPLGVGVVPVLGPVEYNETLLQPETVQRALSTHRASRHFRNYWRHFPDDFNDFRGLVERTWPGMSIRPPELDMDGKEPVLSMFCSEKRIDRELYWVGFGFQVWCQLLTHVIRARASSLIVVDEPEIYLHPDLQRQLARILRESGPDVVLATHSGEIVSECEPTDLVIINKEWKSARHLHNVEEVQVALDTLGSSQNLTLSQLARTRRVVFVEGEDFRLIRRFADKLRYADLAAGFGVTPVPIGGFSQWERVTSLAWGLEKTLQQPMMLAAVFDRDYYPEAEVTEIMAKVRASVSVVHVHERKEIENYLLVPEAIDRAVERILTERRRRGDGTIASLRPASELLAEITAPMRDEVAGRYIGKYEAHVRRARPRIDQTTVAIEAIKWFNSKWECLTTRLEVCPGKDVFGKLNEVLRGKAGINVSAGGVIAAMHAEEVPADMRRLIQKLEEFRKSQLPDAAASRGVGIAREE